MRKAINIFLTLFIIVMGLRTCDMYIGYKISEGVDKVFTTNADRVTSYSNQADNNTVNLNNYLYCNFSNDEKKAYDAIYNAISGFKSTVYVNHIGNADDVFDMVKAVLSEHPEIFWSTGECSYGAGGLLSLDYVYSKNEATEKKKLIEEKADEIISGISGDEYTRALAIYDYIILNTRYDSENIDRLKEIPTDSTIEGVLLNNTAVCAGYAKTYQYLLQKAGLSSLYVIGIGTNRVATESHAWVVQQIDGKYYYTDPTWGDPNQDKLVSHSYFCLTASEISVNHELEDMYPLLTANSLEANFFVRENRYFDEYSVSAVKQVVEESLDNNLDYIEFRYKTPEVYEQAKERLFKDGEIYLALIPSELLTHSINTEKMTIIQDDINRVIMLVYNRE